MLSSTPNTGVIGNYPSANLELQKVLILLGDCLVRCFWGVQKVISDARFQMVVDLEVVFGAIARGGCKFGATRF